MDRITAFDTDPSAVQYTDGNVTNGEFDISVAQYDPAAAEGLYGVSGYAELAQVGVPVAETPTGIVKVRFHVFGVTEGAPFIESATPNATGDGRAEVLLPPGSLAVIDSASLTELTMRAGMTSARLRAYLANLAESGAEGARISSVTAAHAVVGIGPQSVVVGRDRDASFSTLLERGSGSLASRIHFAVALGGLQRAASLRVHATNPTSVMYMRSSSR